MSLVNLAHVCSHLQNASLARLGLTSIPYTKWHLSLSLLLQKQGFLSSVKLGGPSPPASCFGQGPRDDHAVSNFPHGAAGRNPMSGESALARMIRNGSDKYQLQHEGFPQEAIDFAQEHGRRSLDELEKAGWVDETIKFIIETRAEIETTLPEVEQEFDDRLQNCTTVEEWAAVRAELGETPEVRRERVMEKLLVRIPESQAATYRKYSQTPIDDLYKIRFELSDLESLAGKTAYITEREIRRNGITLETMGVRIANQMITLPKEEFQDPNGMETEGVVTQANRASRRLWLGLKYYESSPVLSKAKMVSKPTKRIWLTSHEIANLVRGRRAGEVHPLSQIGEIMAVSTDRGMMEARECMERKIGGMVLCRVW